jgi:hypothetical protein
MRVPAELITELLMKALGITNVDEWLEKIKNGEVAMGGEPNQQNTQPPTDTNAQLQAPPADEPPPPPDAPSDAGNDGNTQPRR